MDQIVLDKKECTYSYFADPMYAFMDAEYNQFEVEAENMGDAIQYLEDGMPVEVVFYDGKAISVELPTTRGARDRRHRAGGQGRHLGQGHEARQARRPASRSRCRCSSQTGDKIEIDTRTHEYRKRV